MKLIRVHITVFLIVFISVATGHSQANLKKLNDQAFTALERHSPDAVTYANQILEFKKENDTSVYVINAYTILGILNKDKGYYISALNYYLKALDGAEKRNDQARISSTLSNIGVLYRLQGNLNLAISYFSKSLKIEEKLKDDLQKSIRYYNIGDCYKELDKFDLALTYFIKSLLIEQKNKNIEGEIYANLGISEVYLEVGQIEDAKKILDKIKVRLKDEFSEVSILYYKLMGIHFFKSNRLDEALLTLKKSENLSKKNDFPIHLLEIYRVEISILERQENWKSVSDKYREYNELSEKLVAIEVRNKVDDMMYSNDLHKKELQISSLQGEKKIADRLSTYNMKIAWFLILLVVFIVGFIFVGFKRNR
jgi:tetratricopeptide (TPR) repeat protein